MSPHTVNNFVSDLVLMAQAVEKLPQVENELLSAHGEIERLDQTVERIRSDLEQSRSYAASLEQKVRDAEVAKDQAETMFLELDEKVEQVLAMRVNAADLVNSLFDKLTPPRPQPEPIVSEVKPITDIGADHSGYHPEQVDDPSLPSQGQSEPDPISTTSAGGETIGEALAQPMEASTSSPGPYAGKRYHDYPDYVGFNDWIAGGGTEADYWPEPPHQGF